MGEVPRHLTADTVSCKQLPTVTTRTTRLSKVESCYAFGPTFLYLRHTCCVELDAPSGQHFSLFAPRGKELIDQTPQPQAA